MRSFLKKIFSVPVKQEKKGYPCRVQGDVNIIEKNGGRIVIHPSVLLNSLQDGYHIGMPFSTTLLADVPGSLITIGEHCRIHGCYIHAWDRIIIGRNVLIAAGTNIVDSHGHSTSIKYAKFRKNFRDRPQAICIGNFVWIGASCHILKGVEIGDCAIISAGSVVKESVPPFSVVEGNPAKVIHVYEPGEALDESFPIEKLALENDYYDYEY